MKTWGRVVNDLFVALGTFFFLKGEHLHEVEGGDSVIYGVSYMMRDLIVKLSSFCMEHLAKHFCMG